MLAFFVDGYGQLQPTRMPQGCHTSTFSLQECLMIAFGYIPPLPPELQSESHDGSFPSLLRSAALGQPPPLDFYADDITLRNTDFDSQYQSLKDHVLPRIDWSMLKLSFKKIDCFQDEILCLGMRHRIHGVTLIKHARAEKIRNWPTPVDAKQVRSFLATIECTRRWVKNYANIAGPLTALLRHTGFMWKPQQQLAFEFLKAKCSDEVESHGIDPLLPTEMYSDASGYAAGCVFIQRRLPEGQATGKKVVFPLLFDSFQFNATQQKYHTYKRELLAIHDFSMKWQHLLRAKDISIIWTDHKPLTYFLDSPYHNDIHARWAADLERLNVQIQYIPGPRNKIADALSRTVFPTYDGNDQLLDSLGQIEVHDGEPHWVWKDGKGGYDELLRLRLITEQTAADDVHNARATVNMAEITSDSDDS
jgi:hypothetical protein